jgi:hypothetical protein
MVKEHLSSSKCALSVLCMLSLPSILVALQLVKFISRNLESDPRLYSVDLLIPW